TLDGNTGSFESRSTAIQMLRLLLQFGINSTWT
ncbi:hypothetical protein A2U01_0062556, partial [Trifolium medium]|nr:hypothetical protein [Trifolium medium]